MTISSVDLPDPDGPTRPIASPRPISRVMSLRMWTRAAPRPSERLTPEREIAGMRGRSPAEVSSMWPCIPRFWEIAPLGSYGKGACIRKMRRVVAAVTLAAVRAAAVAFAAVTLASRAGGARGRPAAAHRRVRQFAHRRLWPSRRCRVSGEARAGARGEGHRHRNRQRRGVRRHHLGRGLRGSTGPSPMEPRR